MKRLLLLLITLLPALTIAQGGLSGNYVVGTGGNFTTITAAVNALNASGVAGNVTFLLDNNSYTAATGETFPIQINDFNGAVDTADNNFTVTFKPNTGKTVTIENNTNTKVVFKLLNADNVIFDGSNNNTASKDLTISYNHTNTTSKRTVFWLASNNSGRGAKNNTIKNLIINQYSKNNDLSIGIFSGDATKIGTQALGSNSGNKIQNITFNKVGQAVYLYGSDIAGRLSSDWIISDNTIGSTNDANKPFLGIYLNQASNYQISNNRIVGVLKNTVAYGGLHSGIILIGSTTTGSVFNNIISDIYNNQNNGYCAGIYINGSNSNTIYNNMISNVRQSSTDNNDYNFDLKGHGIYVVNGQGNKIYYNTVHMNSVTTGGRSSCLHVQNGTTIDIRNNIFYNSQTQGNQYGILYRGVGLTNITSNYNDIFVGSANGHVVRRDSEEYTSLTQWILQTWWQGQVKDLYSLNVAPVFLAGGLYMDSNNASNLLNLDGKATPITGITTDIDGTIRNAAAPDIGANEFGCAVSGDQTTYGVNSWIGYVYDNAAGFNNTTLFQSNKYRGYVTEAEEFNTNYGTGAISGANLCGTYADLFGVRYKMTKNFPAGYYTFTVGGDDGYRLSIDGGVTNIVSNWNDHAYQTSTSAVYYLEGTVNLVLEYYENGSNSQVSFAYSSCTPLSTTPTGISGVASVCLGTSTTLTATGGTAGAGSFYQWGTGTVGSNIIAGQTTGSITVSPTSATTYWVRRVDVAPCAATSAAATVTVTIGAAGDPTLFGDNVWNVYAYNETSLTPSTLNYQGYYTQNTQNVNTQDLTNNGWNQNASPSSSASWVGCNVANDNFTMIHKRKGFSPGSYELRLNNWDDNTKIIVDGVTVFNAAGWYGGVEWNQLLGVFCLNANSTIEVQTIEYTGGATFKMTLVPVLAVYNAVWNGLEAKHAVKIEASLVLEEDLNICTCTVKAGSTLTIKSGTSLVVDDFIIVEPGATLIVEDDANLIQVNNAAVNSGNIQVKRVSSPVKQFDYVYWSSPVNGTTMSTLSSPSIYYSFNPLINNWVGMSASATMTKGVGYIARVSNNLNFTAPLLPTVNTTFNGTQNSGVVNVNLLGNAGATTATKFNLVGNPYPSAIDAEAFILANQHLIDGTLYFWTHQTAISANTPGSEANNYASDDYAKWNLVGGIGTGVAAVGSTTPDGNIASCQGFYVKVRDDVAISSLPQPLVFNNSMRSSGSNSNFYKPAPTQTDQTIYKNRIWLNISNTQGAYSETLLGYVTGATNGFDHLYDGKTLPAGNFVSLYSLLDTQPLVIQGRSLPFNDADVIPLGYSSTIAGTFSISLSQFDGVFQGQAVYLVDKTTNTYTNLKEINYTFQTTTGTFTNRFELRFVPDAALDNNTPVMDQNAVTIFKNGNQIQVSAKEIGLKQVTVFDLQGRMIADHQNINAQSFVTTSLNVSNQVVIVKVIADNDAEVVKKVMMQ